MTTFIRYVDITGQIGSLQVRSYPSGEPLVGRPVHGIVSMLVRPTSMLDLMAALFLVDAVQERSGHIGELIIPFVPGARQDRLNPEGDYLFTAKSVAKEINARKLDRVTIVDPHSEVMPALIDRCRVVHAADIVPKADGFGFTPSKYTAIVSPDAGAEKRAGQVAKALKLPLLHGWKTRDVATGEIAGFGLEPTGSGGHVLVVDDICDGGGTFMGLGAVMQERLMKADLYVTHGIFSKGTDALRGRYFNIMCTDSIADAPAGVDVIPICDKLLRGML